jgi:hypothetical protein
MKKVSNFNWVYDSKVVFWECDEKQVSKHYDFPVRSAVVLDDASGVAVVEPFETSGRDNAVVFNCDGNERFRLSFPLPEPYGNCYDQMYYVNKNLTAFANLRGTDFGYVLDEATGNVIRSFESR